MQIEELEQEVINRLEAGSLRFRHYDGTKIRPVLERGLQVGDIIHFEVLDLTYLGGNRWRADSFENMRDERGCSKRMKLSTLEIERADIHEEMLLRLAFQAATLP